MNTRALTIPRDHPRVTVVSRIAFARGDRLRASDEVVRRVAIGPCRDVRAARLEEGSRVQSLAEPPKHLVYSDENGDGGLNYGFDSGSRIDCPPHDPDSLEEYFGVTENRQVRDLWLTPSKG